MSLEVQPGNSATQFSVNLNHSLDFSQLLTSNDAPLDSDIPIIRAVISDGETHVDALNKQIHDLQLTLAGLVQRRDKMAEQVRQHHAIVSPVRRLPPEKRPPWHVGHICQSWRHTALCYPLLWSSVAVSSTSSPQYTTGVQTQLLRSVNAPLDIYCGNAPYTIDAYSSWFALVIPQSCRWRTLHIHNLGGFDWLRPVEGRLDQLEELTITSCFGANIPDVFTTAPNLRRAIFTDTAFSDRSPFVPLPWGQITHYRGPYPPERPIDILKAAQKLLFWEIDFSVHADAPLNPTTPTLLPRLRGLSVGIAFVLSQLTTPQLETLVLRIARSLFLSILLPLIHRSSCTLNKLVLMQCEIGPELIHVLRELPALAYLLVERSRNGSNPQEFFQAMTFTGATSILCPNLTTMVYGHWSLCSLPQDDFLTMVRSRFQSSPNGASRLGSLRLYDTFDKLPPADLLAQIAMLCAEGFDAAFLDYQDAVSLGGPLV
ncbi:hypothetical protein B0H16DRAFT_1536695 [Mycena metata]|uniref:F-box domain-containing protein n=1 Tax=Mycena metata TaxID=1033252 RepID=A0AAD7NFA3_9AGAR|nr:hypothetical protein B0H16DRAFT_1536695 [Mycena metata]